MELLTDNSPVLIIKNEKQDRLCEVNERQLRGEFTNLKETLPTNLETNRGLPDIKKAIQQYIRNLPHVGTPLPKIWVRVRSALENYLRNYISLEEYCNLCRLNGLTDRQDMLRLSRYLHDLGVCLHFQDDPTLKHYVILKPEWATNAVYKVLDNKTVIGNLGCFSQNDLGDIWKDRQYIEMRDELLQLMMRFKLCYPIPHRSGNYIAPQLLDINQPDYDWDTSNNLILRYKYEFMPKGMITRFIVETHPWIEAQKLVWRSGVILNKNQTRAEVIENYNQKEIKIRVSGTQQKELLAVVTHELDKIHRSFERLKYDILVPCNCKQCDGSQKPYAYPLESLRKRWNAGRYPIECEHSYEMVDVRRLIDDVNLPQQEEYREINTPSTPLQAELDTKKNESLNITVNIHNETKSESNAMSEAYQSKYDQRNANNQFVDTAQSGSNITFNQNTVLTNPKAEEETNLTSATEFEKEIFISYAWGGESEEFVNHLDKTLQAKGITIIRDKRDLGYKGLIKQFMERIGQGKCVIVVISDKYLKSPNCIFELLEVAKNGKLYDRIFPIVLADAEIYKPVQRLKYIKYWEDEIKQFDEGLKEVSAANLQGFREEIDLYARIRNNISELTNILKNMNTLTPDIHNQSKFEELVKAIEDSLG